ncbi:energy transducer TonB [Asaia siamensis]|uniref:energy transducer TonB n=2 Tax=Asaia TaxID=91914 RepID=UPI0038D1DEA2
MPVPISRRVQARIIYASSWTEILNTLGSPSNGLPNNKIPSCKEGREMRKHIIGAFILLLSGCASDALQHARLERPGPQNPRNGPIYPSVLLDKNIQGSASAVCDIYTDGRARNCVITFATHPLFAKALLDSAYKQRYIPASQNGHPVVDRGHSIHANFHIARD